MKYKELVLRRLESIEGKLKRMRNALNERNIEVSREILNEILELRDDTQSIVEREVNS
jgi:predicted nucleotidyltransferase